MSAKGGWEGGGDVGRREVAAIRADREVNTLLVDVPHPFSTD